MSAMHAVKYAFPSYNRLEISQMGKAKCVDNKTFAPVPVEHMHAGAYFISVNLAQRGNEI